MQDKIFDFEKLDVYQKSLDFIDLVYTITETFPNSEIYNIVSHHKDLRENALSVLLLASEENI